jgi:hypothetical protein
MGKLILIAGCLAALAGCATDPEARLSAIGTQPESEPCIQTGTRIRLDEGECAAVSGRTYSQEELQSTGAFSLAESLRKLDPSLGR